MARIKRLTAKEVETRGAGSHSDGANLYLRVRDTGQRSWVFRYQRGGRSDKGGKAIEIGLGGLNQRSLKDARTIAAAMRAALMAGTDPATLVKTKAVADPDTKTFKAYALELIEAKRSSWKSQKTGKLWAATLEQYAYPTIGNKHPRDVTLDDVELILKPMWKKKDQGGKVQTASKLRTHIEAVIDFAMTKERIEGHSNPARWIGNLEHVGFAKLDTIAERTHHAAADYKTVPAIMATLRDNESTAALCLRWTILTAARSSETLGATFSEIDETKRMWVIPEERMKKSREHNVPLCDEALQILTTMKRRRLNGCEFIFPGAKLGRPVSDVTVNATLHAINPNIKVHGFRSSFSQWGAATLSNESDAIEFALAHVEKNKSKAAYQTNNLFDRRIAIMNTWGNFCAGKSNVVLAQ